MIKLKTALNPEVAKLLSEKYPIVKKRTALWFFTDELQRKRKKELEIKHQGSDSRESIKLCRVRDQWNKMDPESKRKYFNMAELDEVRYKGQKTLWLAQIGSLLVQPGDQMEKLNENHLGDQTSKIDNTLTMEFDRYLKNCERMIQTQSTRMLYKDVIEKTKNLDINLTTESLISAIPEDYRPVLTRPRRPAVPFILYTRDQKQQITSLKEKVSPEQTFSKFAGMLWTSMKTEERAIYESKYNKLMEKYNEAMLKFKKKMLETNDDSLEQASKEKKAFRKSLRRKLRQHAVVPLNVRNAFNFFLMDNKDVPLKDLTEVWRNLPEEQKSKYKLLNQQDMIRYHKEKRAYDEVLRSLEEVTKGSQGNNGS